ncbi:adenosine deaminase [Terfezia boudieri ATCC MYA-4762]|uniref:Adenosine deaminase n=1 Tax=Terfezia boudieri ATCC MYA-4762 TaxID=1051890 RepID=A0A3N4MC33_9PEZI|nr:adenosine deaminase [Terfezia boudieri ATCC MYA-4762]
MDLNNSTESEHSALQEFCKKLPKIELHAHLTGSITRECLHRIWMQKKEAANQEGLLYDLEDPIVVIPSGKVDYDLVTCFPLFSNYIYRLCNDVATITYSTNAVLQDFDDDGVVYLELRTTPREFKETGLTKAQYIEAVLNSINDYNTSSSTMKTYLILSIDRRDTPEKAQESINLATRYQGWGVVGVDLCGDPLKGDIASFRPHFAQARAAGLKITLHFGEVAKTSAEEDLRLLLSFKPDRLSHVIHIPESIREELRKRNVALELCISCNVHAKMLIGDYGDHHFGMWFLEQQCPVVLCTDDVGVFCSPLSNEYALVAEHFQLTPKQLYDLSYSGIKTIFAGKGEKDRLESIFRAWKQEEGAKLI